jgi:nicotinate-nucleotide pyrophosphorylase (carboxylating)
VGRDFQQIEWNSAVEQDCRDLVRLAVREDLDRGHDWTTVALVPEGATGKAALVPRRGGVISGLAAARVALAEMDPQVAFSPLANDGDAVVPGQQVATIEGAARSLLTCERILLNLVGRLSGVSTLTRQYVDQIAGTKARIYDTRKTTPGWRRLEKLAVRCGGGHSHRLGLYDAVLIKDNHLAFGIEASSLGYTPAEAVRRVRELSEHWQDTAEGGWIIEVEVDTLAQLDEVLPAGPDIVLLDNMTLEQLREAFARRNAAFPAIELEASGGVNLQTIRGIAETGVDRISVGALTHSAVCLDIGLDWL